MVTLTVKIPKEEIDALRFACAATDEAMYLHESVDVTSQLATVTIEVRSVEMLFYMIRSFDSKVEYDRFKASIKS